VLCIAHINDRQRPKALRYFLWCLGGIIITAALIGIVAARSYNGERFKIKGRKHIEMDHVFNGTFWAQSTSVHWVPEGIHIF
jgi:dipeptidyl aminopeptidase